MNQHRRVFEVSRPLGRGDDEADPAVVDQAVVEQTERLGDVARALVVVHRDRTLHHRVGIQRRVGPIRDRQMPQRLRRRAVAVLVTPEHQRCDRARRCHPIRRFEHRLGRNTAALTAILRPRRAPVVAVDASDDIGHPIRNSQCCILQRNTRLSTLPRQHIDKPGMPQSNHLAHPPIVRQPRDNHPIDIGALQAGVPQRFAEGDQAEFVGRALRVEVAVDRAELSRADADNRRLVLEIAEFAAVRLVAHAGSLGRVQRLERQATQLQVR